MLGNRLSSHTPKTDLDTKDSSFAFTENVQNLLATSSKSVPTYSTTFTDCKTYPVPIKKDLQQDEERSRTSENATNHAHLVNSCIGRSIVQHLSNDHSLLSWPAWPIFAALRQHGLMQGILAGNCLEEGKSLLPPIPLPEALKPTPLQLVKSHRRVIDRFPFPRLRDNMILLESIIDLDEFVRDVFEMSGLIFRSESWRATWDPDAWSLGPQFSRKWGYLFN